MRASQPCKGATYVAPLRPLAEAFGEFSTFIITQVASQRSEKTKEWERADERASYDEKTKLDERASYDEKTMRAERAMRSEETNRRERVRK